MDIFEMIQWLQLIASWVNFMLGIFEGIKVIAFGMFDILLLTAVHLGPWLIGLWVICQVGDWMFSAGKKTEAAEQSTTSEAVATQESSESSNNGAVSESATPEEDSPEWWTESETVEKEGMMA